ncbi:Uncharacterized membrane-anchored protein YjiN, DUF445 family [Sphingomonas jatrophae]|uniref:Uncharacterized membrane-anchored protein YjiN, DUF445 family n=2 Tax=Sphingomonas jatrophae TaxID=1166337 RepID=A0A1I6JYU1_9SPHN|nr:Uncharacterized membrane-anchored protein YjiN, DUF445 family [Sphingomonas jatrophae]
MRRTATGLLVVMAGLFGLARWMEPAYPAWSFVRAFAEAAMVGGMADWFAVTALFRHPLGIPIPHTAIIPNNKDRIAETLARFLRENFLTPIIVSRRMQRIDVAGAVGRFLADPVPGGRLRKGAGRLLADALEALDPERLGTMVRGGLVAQLRRLEVAPLIGQALAAAMTDGRHRPIIDTMILWADRTLDANQVLIRESVAKRAGSLLRWTGLDERLANAILDALHKLLAEMAADPDHPVRAKSEEGMAELAHRLQHDPELRAKVEHAKEEILDNPAISLWWQGVWEQARAGLLRAARSPDTAVAGFIGDGLRQLGDTLQREPRLAHTINRFARRATVGITTGYGDQIVRVVSETVRRWDTETLTGRLEQTVGRDLQYIRINGTLVGGLVGLLIHTFDTLI